jgi:hypothetical protein
MASKLTSADISEITRQSDVISKPVRDNFTNLKNKTNELVDEIAAAAIGTTNAETTASRPYHSNLKERLDSIWDGKQNYIKNGGAVTEQAAPDMTVAIAAGEAKISGIDCKWSAQNSAAISAPGANTRLDLVVAQSDSTITVVTGAAAASPVFPSVSSTQVVLAALVVKAATASLNEGTEIFNVLNFENPYFPNLYINTAYTATNKSHNNVIVDLSSAVITGTLECQGYCHIIEYDNPGADGSGEGAGNSSITGCGYDADDDWRIANQGTSDILDGTNYDGVAPSSGTPVYIGASGSQSSASDLSINAYSIYINNIDLSGGFGDDGVTERDANDFSTAFPISGKLYTGASGGAGATSKNITLNAIDEITINGTVDLSGGDGGDAGNASSGSVGNLGGGGGGGGDGGDFTYTCKTYTNNGTLTQSAGSGGTGGTGSGGSNNNGNGSNGSSGSAGSTSATTYDFTDGLPSGYGDWIHPLYMGYNLSGYLL